MEILTIRLAEGQKTILKAMTKAQGFGTISEWLRDMVRKEEEKETLKKLLTSKEESI